MIRTWTGGGGAGHGGIIATTNLNSSKFAELNTQFLRGELCLSGKYF